MHIGYLSQYFLPEFAAPAVRIQELGRVWMALGHRVSVLTGFPQYPHGRVFPGYRGRLFKREEVDGFEVTRTAIVAPRGRSLGTALNYLSFPVSAATAALVRRVPRPDVWIATSPPLFIGMGALALRALQRVPLVFEVRDLWPDSVVDLGEVRPGRRLDALYRLERRLYEAADAVVTVADSAVEAIAAKGIDRAKLFSVPNGAEVVDTPALTAEERAAARARFGVHADAFVVGYVGTHGRSQRLHALAPAVRALAGEGVQFVFVGDGAEKPQLQHALAGSGALLLPSQPRAAISSLYGLCDVCLVPLGDFPVVSRAIPSKLFEIMGHARPFVALVRGDAAEIGRRSGAGEVAEPEDTAALVEAVRRLRARGAEGLEAMGRAGREYLRACYTRERMALRYLDVLERVVSQAAACAGADLSARPAPPCPAVRG